MQIRIASSIVLFQQRMREHKITMTKIEDKRIIESTSFWFKNETEKNIFSHTFNLYACSHTLCI